MVISHGQPMATSVRLHGKDSSPLAADGGATDPSRQVICPSFGRALEFGSPSHGADVETAGLLLFHIDLGDEEHFLSKGYPMIYWLKVIYTSYPGLFSPCLTWGGVLFVSPCKPVRSIVGNPPHPFAIVNLRLYTNNIVTGNHSS